ncbi:MAG TPA: VanZ family protein [Pyrinomonadaceae bacterium]|jgi:VanZ family protein|nr:VanZ family protein [Pyrinomonadaceae bacterium]
MAIGTAVSFRQRLWRYAPVLLWVSIILFLGSNPGSMSETSRFIRPLLQFLFPDSTEATIDLIHGYIRKSAHLFEYAVLAALTARALVGSSVSTLKKFSYAVALLLVLVVASIDEFHQSYEPSRTSSPYDVLIDITGGVLALVIVYGITALIRRRERTAPAA